MADTKDLKKFRGGIRLDASTDTAPSNPEVGAMYVDTNGTLKIYNGSAWDSVGSGAGTTNYISTAESKGDSVAGFTTYTDAAAVTPVDGFSDPPATTSGMLTQDTSTKLRGLNSVKLLKKESTAEQGMGIAYDFTIDKADKAKKMLISFDYMEGTSGDYKDGDARVFIYDKDNSKLIRVNGEDIKANTGMATHHAQFQTAADSDDYRLIIHIADADNGATHDWELFLDNISVAPIVANTNSDFSGRDVIFKRTHQTATAVATGGDVLIPWDGTGTNIDTTSSWDAGTSKYTVPETGYYDVRVKVVLQTTSDFDAGEEMNVKLFVDGAVEHVGSMFETESATSASLYAGSEISSLEYLTKGQLVHTEVYQASGDPRVILSDNDYNFFSIAKRQSAVSVTPGASGRDVAAIGHGLGGSFTMANATNVQITNWNNYTDTTNSFDGTYYTFPETGYYDVNFAAHIASDGDGDITLVRALIYEDTGSGNVLKIQNVVQTHTEESQTAALSHTMHMNKGDKISFWVHQANTDADTMTYFGHGDEETYFSIAKRQSAQTLLDNETIACRVTKDDAQSIGSGSTVPIRYDDVTYDTHGAYHLTDDKYTVPVTGYYDIYAKMRYVDLDESAGDNYQMYILVGGVNISQISDESNAAQTTSRSLQIQDTLLLNKGDEVTIGCYQATGSGENTVSQATDMVLTIKKIK